MIGIEHSGDEAAGDKEELANHEDADKGGGEVDAGLRKAGGEETSDRSSQDESEDGQGESGEKGIIEDDGENARGFLLIALGQKRANDRDEGGRESANDDDLKDSVRNFESGDESSQVGAVGAEFAVPNTEPDQSEKATGQGKEHDDKGGGRDVGLAAEEDVGGCFESAADEFVYHLMIALI